MPHDAAQRHRIEVGGSWPVGDSSHVQHLYVSIRLYL